MASRYLNQCWFIFGGVLWHPPDNNFTGSSRTIIQYNEQEDYTSKITIPLLTVGNELNKIWLYIGIYYRHLKYFRENLQIVSNESLRRPTSPPCQEPEQHFDKNTPDSKVRGANMGPTWVLPAPDGPHIAPWTLLSGTRPVIIFGGPTPPCQHLDPVDIFVTEEWKTDAFEATSQIANFMGPTWGPTWVLSAPDGPHVGPMNLAIRVTYIGWACSLSDIFPAPQVIRG